MQQAKLLRQPDGSGHCPARPRSIEVQYPCIANWPACPAWVAALPQPPWRSSNSRSFWFLILVMMVRVPNRVLYLKEYTIERSVMETGKKGRQLKCLHHSVMVGERVACKERCGACGHHRDQPLRLYPERCLRRMCAAWGRDWPKTDEYTPRFAGAHARRTASPAPMESASALLGCNLRWWPSSSTTATIIFNDYLGSALGQSLSAMTH